MEKRYVYLDWIRIVALFFILYGHLANAASFITQEATVFSHKYVLPINNADTHKAYIFDVWLSKFDTSSAVIGVILFFLLSGYLTAMTREKYNKRGEFLKKRIIRIYPGLFIAVTVCGVIAAFMGVKYSAFQYISNCLLLYPFMGVGATIGTLWTLVVEVIFYCIVQHFEIINFKNIMIIDGVILFFTIAQAVTGFGSYSFIYSLKFVPIILFGVMMHEFHCINGIKKYGELAIVAFITYLIPYIAITYTYTNEVNYKSPASYIFALCIWGGIYVFHSRYSDFPNVVHRRLCIWGGTYVFHRLRIRMKSMYCERLIDFIVDISYFVYLLQLNIGFVVMYFLREAGIGPYINIICGVAAIFVVSALLHYLCEKPIQKILNHLLMESKTVQENNNIAI